MLKIKNELNRTRFVFISVFCLYVYFFFFMEKRRGFMYFRIGGIPNRVLKSSGGDNCDSGLPLL